MDARTTWPALLAALIRGDSLTADESARAMSSTVGFASGPRPVR